MDYEKEIPFGAFNSELMQQEINIPEGFEANIKGDKIILKKIESDDDKIRKYLIRYIDNTMRSGTLKSKLLAWLEKQGEQKQYDIDVLEKHITKDSISELAHTVIVRNGWEIVDAKEQNPVWSEEDEEHYKACLQCFEVINPDMVYYKDYLWLISLKQRIGGKL